MATDAPTTKTTPAAPPVVRRTERPDLVGWKQIAAHLGVDATTARRWADRGLPVYVYGPRLIVAYSAEIDAWALRPRG
jgi:hypothetical protein